MRWPQSPAQEVAQGDASPEPAREALDCACAKDKDVTLIRHAYVRTASRGRGIGGQLLAHLRPLTDRPILIGTWAAAVWAVGFYRKHGFHQVTPEQKNRLLATYWDIPERQVETSVVLAGPTWVDAPEP